MPRVDVWIRKDDYEVWKRIEDKPGFLRASIRAFTEGRIEGASALLKAHDLGVIDKKVLGVLDAIPQVQKLKFCRHGYDPLLCKYAKPGKPCK